MKSKANITMRMSQGNIKNSLQFGSLFSPGGGFGNLKQLPMESISERTSAGK